MRNIKEKLSGTNMTIHTILNITSNIQRKKELPPHPLRKNIKNF